MTRTQFQKGRAKARGSILIAILGMIALLSLLLVSFLNEAVTRIRYNGLLDRSSDLRERAYSGLEIALASISQLAEIDEGLKSVSQGWNDPLGYVGMQEPFDDCTLEASCEDEGAKLPLALMSEEQLNVLFEELGLMSADAERLSVALLDWMDPDDNARVNGFDGDDYEQADIPCAPSNAVPRSYEELFLVQGFADHFRNPDGSPADIFEEFCNAVSLESSAKVNINDASPFVLRVLGELGNFDEERVERLMEGDDRLRGTLDDHQIENADELDATGDTSLLAFDAQLLRVRVVATRGDARFWLDALVTKTGSSPDPPSASRLDNTRLNQSYEDFPANPESALYYPVRIVRIRENRNR